MNRMKLDMEKEYEKVSADTTENESLEGDFLAVKVRFLYLVGQQLKYSKFSQSHENHYLNVPRLIEGIEKVRKEYYDELMLKRSITREKVQIEKQLRKDFSSSY